MLLSRIKERVAELILRISFFAFFCGTGMLTTMPAKRAHHALVYDADNKCILMTAGSTPLAGGESYTFYNDIWTFNGKTWKDLGTSADVRSGIGLAYDTKRKKVYSFGGYSKGGRFNDLRVLESGQWKVVSEIPGVNVAEPGFVYDSKRDKLVVFGGSAGRGRINSDTWEWDGTQWIKFNGTGPEGRQGFAMVYDEKRGKAVLYGGMITPDKILADTWEYDGSTWTKVNESGPGARTSPGYAYDAKRNMFVIFGGELNGKPMGDTWGWDGKQWRQLSGEGPSARTMGYMAYDKDRDRIVLFGGRPAWLNDANDTWEWDGKEWWEIKF